MTESRFVKLFFRPGTGDSHRPVQALYYQQVIIGSATETSFERTVQGIAAVTVQAAVAMSPADG